MASAPLSDHQVLQEIRRLVLRDQIHWTDHGGKQMAKRGISRSDAKACLRSGFLNESSFVTNRPGEAEYKYTVEGTIDGRRLRVGGVVKPDDTVVVNTAF